MNFWREFHGPNAGYVLELYERYRNDPSSVDAATREAYHEKAVESLTAYVHDHPPSDLRTLMARRLLEGLAS